MKRISSVSGKERIASREIWYSTLMLILTLQAKVAQKTYAYIITLTRTKFCYYYYLWSLTWKQSVNNALMLSFILLWLCPQTEIAKNTENMGSVYSLLSQIMHKFCVSSVCLVLFIFTYAHSLKMVAIYFWLMSSFF